MILIIAFVFLGSGCTDAEKKTADKKVLVQKEKSEKTITLSQTATKDDSHIKTKQKPQLLSFSRNNCLPCEIMDPWVTHLQKEFKDTVEIAKINLDDQLNHQKGRQLQIKSVPTQIYLSAKRDELYRHEGLATKIEMKRVLCKLKFVQCDATPSATP